MLWRTKGVRRIGLAVCLTVAVTAGIAAANGSKHSRWVMVDLLKLARQRYPAYVRVEPIGFGEQGEVLWTASKLYAVDNLRRYTDESLQHVFAWRNGKTRDLGSLGQSDNLAMAINHRDQIAVSRSPYVPSFGPPVLGQKRIAGSMKVAH